MDIQALKEELGDLKFDIQRAARYHRRRQSFFIRLDSLCNFISLLFGSSLIYAVLSPNALKSWLFISAFTITFFSAISLLGAFSQKARDHSDFARRYINLESEIIDIDENNLTKNVINDLTKKRLKIEIDEMPILRILDNVCYNDIARSIGASEADFIDIKWYQRLFAPFFDIGTHKLKKVGEKPTDKK